MSSSHGSPFPDRIPFRTLGSVPALVWGGLLLLVVVGAAALVLGWGEHHGRVWEALLFNWLFWSSLALGMVMFAVVLQLTEADWAWSIRRFPLAGVAFLPISLLLMPIILIGGHEHFFHHWLHVTGDPVIEAKRAWLSWPGLAVRDILGVIVLYGLAVAFAYFSLRPDVYGCGTTDGQRGWYRRLTGGWRGVEAEAKRGHDTRMKLGVFLGLAYAFLWGMVAIDMAMSMMPHWFSTMFPVAFFWTGFHGGVAATAIAVTLLRKPAGIETFVTKRQYHDLGKLVFAFSVFWMYLNWSQYVVIWYGLLPHEQEFFVQRFSQPFTPIAQAVPMLVFVLPFFGLLARPPKMIPAILSFFAVLILVGHWLERFLLIAPSLYEGGEHGALPLGLLEIGVGLGFMGLFVASYLWFVRTFPLLPSPATLNAAEPSVVMVPVSAES